MRSARGAGATPVTVTAALNGGTRAAATPVTVTVGSGTATADTDFEAVTGFTITIPANSASHTGSFVLIPTQDTVDEPDETVEVNGTTAIPDFAVTDARVEIADDDAAPTVTLSLSDTSIGEAGGIATVTASLDHASSEPTTVTVNVAPDSPATSSDYSLSANRVLTIAADATTSTGTVTIAGRGQRHRRGGQDGAGEGRGGEHPGRGGSRGCGADDRGRRHPRGDRFDDRRSI